MNLYTIACTLVDAMRPVTVALIAAGHFTGYDVPTCEDPGKVRRMVRLECQRRVAEAELWKLRSQD